MLPNVVAPHLTMLKAFLGFGVSEPRATWRLMLREAAVEFPKRAPWMTLYPGIAVSLSVFAFNLFGDLLRDALDDPKLTVSLTVLTTNRLGRRTDERAGGLSTGH
jgi:peptide/nickel transport system permease protein